MAKDNAYSMSQMGFAAPSDQGAPDARDWRRTLAARLARVGVRPNALFPLPVRCLRARPGFALC